MRSILFATLMLCSAATLADQEGACDIDISGTFAMTSQSKSLPIPPKATYEQSQLAKRVNATADYWLSDTQIRSQLEVMANISRGSKKTPVALKADVDARMRKDPRLYLVAIGCGDRNLILELMPASGSKYADVPFKPGHYVIASNAGTAKPGQFVAQLSIGEYPNADAYRSSAPGTLDIEQFDAKGLAGKFAFQAADIAKTKAINLIGTFKYSCVGDKCAK
jgi:hypothetical protein